MSWRGSGAVIVSLAIVLSCAAPAGATSYAGYTSYTLAGGCLNLNSASSGQTADKLRMQATALGSYLLYRSDRTFLTAQGDGSVAPEDQPSAASDWRVAEAEPNTFTLSPASSPSQVLIYSGGHLAVAPRTTAGNAARFSFTQADGCPVYPEAELNAHGTPSRGKTPWGTVGGFLEGHMHWMTFEYIGGDFHCGRPWHPYGIPFALPDCSSVEGPEGAASPVQNFLNFGQPAAVHDTRGYPQMTEWGAHNLTYEGTYWRWIQRAWMSGLRLMVMSVNENRVLCELMARKHTNCDEMDTVRRGYRDIRELQQYVDAQAGGPGRGFFQIVTSPNQARRVINQGKMAVVLEIEVSELFGCRGWDTSTCDKAQIDRELNEFYGMGMRSSLLLNKFDNPLTGVRFDAGPIGVLINGGNHQSAGSFWSAETCKGKFQDNTIETFQPQSSSFLAGLLAQLGVTGGTLPAYPPAPHCNTRGLTTLGRYLERQMIKKHIIINPDHMSQRGVDDTLTLLESKHYSGVISPHGWMDPGNWPRIWKLGGLAFPDSNTSSEYVKDYRKYRPRRTPYMLGWGYGADLGGLATQPDAGSNSIHYPFRSYDGKVTFDRQRTGERVFDYNKEGVAHYGLYADWFEDLRHLGGPRLSKDMWKGAEAYLEMWERATGIRAPRCQPQDAGLDSGGLGPIRLRDGWAALLRRVGQPQRRTRAWTWCTRGLRNAGRADVAELSRKGRVELAGSTAFGRGEAGIEVGARARRLKGIAHPIGHGLFLRDAHRAAFVWAVRHGRVRAVGVATRRLALHRGALREAMGRVIRAHASQARRRFVPASLRAARLTGNTLAGSTGDPRLNRALAVLCGLH